ncbi:hypothetical protein F5X68DRAFT_244432 [Plectosphaerella plurivora]|uniref:Uncharacterized protein n=1 Tax=Plectosphaerella plurivora TaxID=936078 RepID=A0A9P9AFV7_9PEZI|nr:hypothetical protein F5X68DRAFT_244432 [Plectosphaerella plurivora]
MVKDLERADLDGSVATQSSDAGRIGKKLFIFTKSRFSRILRLLFNLGCSSHQSMIPPVDLPTQAFASKSIYADALRNVTENGSKESSGLNYDFLAKQYPVGDVPDLAAQVAKFLDLPKPVPPPRETTWVFTFGTWDAWALAALPLQQGNITVRAIAASIFEQIEVLYEASMDPVSPAHSDYYIYTTETSSILRSFSKNPAARPIETFRVIIPRLFDISLTPGWHTLRQQPPAPHSMSEHLQAAAILTRVWDEEIKSRLAAWKNLPVATKIREDQPMQNGRPYYGFWNPSTKKPSQGGSRHDVLYAPYPSRTGVQVDLGDFATRAIIENQLRAYKLPDSDGRGTVDEADALYFEVVDEPCVWHEKTSLASRRTATCEDPESHLFYGPFTVDEKAIRETARRVTEGVIDALYRGR